MLYLLYYNSYKKFKMNLNKMKYKKMQFMSIMMYNLMYIYLSCMMLKSNNMYLVLSKNNIMKMLYFLKNLFSLKYSQLLDIMMVDSLEMKSYEIKSFNFIYVLLSVLYNFSMLICGFLFLFEMLPSSINLFKSADWLESENWDMFGMFFSGHVNLSRMLTDYGFMGFPLSKDFPLSGYFDLSYDEITKSIVLEPLELMQEFSLFKLEIPWRK